MKMNIRIKKLRPKNIFDIRRIKYMCFFLVYVETVVSKAFPAIPHWYTISTLILLLFDVDTFVCIKEKKVSKLILMILGFFSYFSFVTLFMNTNDFLLAVMRTIRAVSFFYVVNSMFRIYKREKALDYLRSGLEVLIYINLIAMILYPNGLYHTITIGVEEQTIRNAPGFIRTAATRVHWLLGHQTTLIRYVIPTLLVAFFYSNIKANKTMTVRNIVLVCACVVEIIIAKSATNYVTIMLFVGVYLFNKFHVRIKWYHVLIFSILLYTVFINISDNMAILLWLSNITGRSVKLSTRAPIWLNSINAWLSSPIFGLGYVNESSVEIRNMLGRGNPHSDYLWILFEGGIIGMIMFIYIITRVWQRGVAYKNNDLAMLAYSALICFMVGILTDDYIFREQFYMVVIIMCYNIPLFCDKFAKQKQ